MEKMKIQIHRNSFNRENFFKYENYKLEQFFGSLFSFVWQNWIKFWSMGSICARYKNLYDKGINGKMNAVVTFNGKKNEREKNMYENYLIILGKSLKIISVSNGRKWLWHMATSVHKYRSDMLDSCWFSTIF